ncbi:MAG: ABC transporter ATP-binding protein [Planctomycetaceae bacterium]|nr:ABC transporter ATP-binding protein [Planctomycetaceae bacterium]
MTASAAVEISHVTHRYGARTALDDVGFSVASGEIFGILGPNGGGKTTLFRLLSTLIPLQTGVISVLGRDIGRQTQEVRRELGIVFQSPSLDKKLTVGENLRHQGHLYGLAGRELHERIDELLARLRLSDRRADLVETLSGGLRRRVELAKGMLHDPRVLVLDEPSTGLDPGARSDLWEYLRLVRREHRVTILLTTHLLEEAEKADRLAILDRGKLVALDTPDHLRATVGNDTITIATDEPEALVAGMRERFGGEPRRFDDVVRFETTDGGKLVAPIVEAFPGQVKSITLGKPTLEDVFIARTGHRFLSEEATKEDAGRHGKRRKAAS